ncbi:MAG: hypothetical protein WCK00_11340 [Deltaproteobacteria bacterium]
MNVLSFIIEAKDKATATLNKIKGQFGELKGDWAKAMEGMKEGSYSGLLSFGMKLLPVIAAVGTGLKGLGEGFKWVGEGLNEFAKIETLTIRMSNLTGSMKTAREAVLQLTSGGNAVDDLFGEEDVIQAAISLKRLSGGALGTASDIKVLAAAAYDTGQSVSSVAHEIGGLAGMIAEGVSGWERYAKGIAKAGIISFETVKSMHDMKEAGRSAGEIIEFMWQAIDQDHTGSLEKARASIEGVRKVANDAMGDMKRMMGATFGGEVNNIWQNLRGGFAAFITDTVNGFMFLSDIITGVLQGKTPKGIYDSALDNYEARNKKAIAESPTTGLAGTINKNASKSDDQKAAEKKAADDRAELLKKQDEAQKKLEDEQRTRKEKVVALSKEKAGLLIDTQSRDSDGTDAAIKAETRILEINAELLKLKKEITAEDEKRAEKEESLMKRDRALREMGMTVDQKREASKKRAAELGRELEKETDPDKRLNIKDKMMDEAEKQASLKGGMRSLSVSDLFTKADKGVSGGQRDPVREGNAILNRIEGILVKIEKAPGGMTK